MKLVLDACVAIKWALPEEDSEQAIALGQQYKQRIHDLIAPDTFPAEVAHAITRAERKGLINQQDGAKQFKEFLSALPAIHQSLPLLPRAYELSSEFRIGVFDCLYITLAERERCQVVTADQRMLTLFPAEAIPLSSL